MDSTPSVLMIHSPLVGSSTWHPCANVLRKMDYAVVAPSLSDALITGPPYYERMADHLAAAVPDSAEVIAIIAHSGAGAVVPAVAERLRARCYGIFVDAILPHPEKSWFETAPAQLRAHLYALVRNGTLPQWDRWFPAGTIETLLPVASLRERFVAELPRIPVNYLEEHAPSLSVDALVGCGYLRLSRACEDNAAKAEQLGWPTLRELADHLAILTRPEMVCAAIVRLFEALNL
jgi:pimeloyl-ACP methyl ester carboxylesterase